MGIRSFVRNMLGITVHFTWLVGHMGQWEMREKPSQHRITQGCKRQPMNTIPSPGAAEAS